MSADPTARKPPPANETLPARAPSPLTASKKLEAVNRAIKVLGGAQIKTLPPLFASVTPSAPVANGVTITRAAPIEFIGPNKTYPQGTFLLLPPSGGTSEVRIELPATKGSRYLADCTMQQVAWSGAMDVSFTHQGSAKTSVPDDNGHRLYTFYASATNEKIVLSVPKGFAFFGCEVSKLD